MKLKNLKIGSQMRIGLGIIMFFVIILGALAFYQADKLWDETEGLYNHPLIVRRAIGELTAEILSAENSTKELLLADNDKEREVIIQQMDLSENSAAKKFTTLYERYLGPKNDVITAENAFIQWKSIHHKNIQLIIAGQLAEAKSRIKSNGVSGIQVNNLLTQIQKISNFALQRGDKFYSEAKLYRDSLIVQLAVVLCLILALMTVVSVVLLNSIKEPLIELTNATREYMNGNMEVRTKYTSNNEFGILASSFNNLTETVEMELKNREAVARVAEVLLSEDELHSFCNLLLKALIEQTGSQIGAIYLLNEKNDTFEHFESIGLTSIGRITFSADKHTGEFGSALATRKIQYITDIPDDTRFKFATVSGDFIPNEIITIPILASQDGVVAVVSLASIKKYSTSQIRLVNDVWRVLIARLNGVLAFRKISAFSELLSQQNSELEAQKKEMQFQRDELTEQNIELEMQKNQLDEASRLKSAFLSNMSHELRTPLNSVIALSSVLNRRLEGVIPDEEYGYIDVIERNGKMLLSLINDILDLSRIEAGKEEINLNRFSIRDVIMEVITLIEPMAKEKGIDIIAEIDDDITPIRSDYTKCRHIIQNIISNAVKFTAKGNVTVNCRQHNDWIEICVSDTGIGIAEDKIRYIFDEFRQADESMSRLYGGSGLGLTIAKKYTTILHGTITVESKPNIGSTFTITFPLSINSTEQIVTDIVKRPLQNAHDVIPKGDGKTILIVEDSEPAIIQLTDIIVAQGYNVRVAHNGQEAIEQIEKVLPDAVILDLMMPEVDGFEVLRVIRGSEKTSLLPVIILTAKHITKEELSFLTGNHVHQLIQKGDVNKNDLLKAVAKMVAIPQVKVDKKPKTVNNKPINGKPVVLVVEDNPDNMMTVKALLQEHFVIIEAEDGAKGLEQAINHIPHLILMDISLPVMDGIKTFNAIRTLENLQHIPIIALTASAMKGNREEILSYGFDGYLPKPVDEKLLIKTISEKLNAPK